MGPCVSQYTCVCTHVYGSTCELVYLCACACVWVHVWASIPVCMCTCVWVHVWALPSGVCIWVFRSRIFLWSLSISMAPGSAFLHVFQNCGDRCMLKHPDLIECWWFKFRLPSWHGCHHTDWDSSPLHGSPCTDWDASSLHGCHCTETPHPYTAVTARRLLTPAWLSLHWDASPLHGCHCTETPHPYTDVKHS